VFKTIDGGISPTRGSKYSACIDLYSSHDIVIGAGETKLVGLGVCIDLEFIKKNLCTEWIGGIDNGFSSVNERMVDKFLNSHYLQLMLRSSLGKKGLILPNGVGVIDIDYKDEIKMIIHNPIKTREKDGLIDRLNLQSFQIIKGDKIGQITLLEHKSYLFGIKSDAERDGGFGSTGE